MISGQLCLVSQHLTPGVPLMKYLHTNSNAHFQDFRHEVLFASDEVIDNGDCLAPSLFYITGLILQSRQSAPDLYSTCSLYPCYGSWLSPPMHLLLLLVVLRCVQLRPFPLSKCSPPRWILTFQVVRIRTS